LFLDAERGTELSYNLFNYFPDAHYRKVIDTALDEEAPEQLPDDQLRPDGGRYADTFYAWYDPDTDAYLTHVEAGEEFASPFFDDEETARRYLDQRAHEHYDPPETYLDEFFESVRGIRSMSVGDIVELDETYFMAAPVGWQEITLEGDT